MIILLKIFYYSIVPGVLIALILHVIRLIIIEAKKFDNKR